MGKEIILFETKDHSVTLKVPVENETVWLNRNQMARWPGLKVPPNAQRSSFFCGALPGPRRTAPRPVPLPPSA